MDWIKSYNFLPRNARAIGSSEENRGAECDPQACYDSFKQHWQQALKIIHRAQHIPTHDDVLGVVNHLEQMATLLLYDIKKQDGNICATPISSKCLEYLLKENILHKIFEWSNKSGKYTNAVRCEQLKLFDMLITQSRHVLLVHEPFYSPLIKLLNSCLGQVFSKEIEKLLVDLLNQLSALLMQHPDFIDLFFYSADQKSQRFIIFALLMPFVHREDSIGMRARDALLLCMSLSKKNKSVALYIADHSNFSVLVASGLSGLYSVLPNIIDDILVPDWHRFTPDDVNEIKGLLTFVTSLEFSNAVAQVAHPIIRKQLQEFLYRGFLIPVLGPALLQASEQEQVAPSAYLELILRTLTEPGLLHSLLQFLLKMDYDGERLLNILIQRVSSNHSQLSLVSLAVFESLVDLNCEDIMLELVFKFLQPCLHLMLSQRHILLPLDPLCQSFEKLLGLAPKCCEVLLPLEPSENQVTHSKSRQTLYGKYYAYLCDARSKITRCQMACLLWNNAYTGSEESDYQDDFTNEPLSLEKSSGYESLNFISDESKEIWQVSSNKTYQKSDRAASLDNNNEQFNSSGSAGPFLTVLMEKLKNYLTNSFYVNLHLTGLISRLAAYPQPLLRAYLLDHSLVLQPNVPSLFEIIGLLKQQIDEYMTHQQDYALLIKYSKECLIEREIMLVNVRRIHTDAQTIKTEAPLQEINHNSNSTTFHRNGPKRRSLNMPSITSMFGRRPSHVESTSLVTTPESFNSNFHLVYPKFNEGQKVALYAILLDEWVKELAALAQEHTIAQIANLLK
ncbi:unnamed protein product [Brassicogethes aeneus]|uniref:FHF complex subunit HOOK-interacting protein C-terminal domain-containing protein n=1 Tax=Brassicogethes aeneus TaxID=1431903 RepID=A0A9P0BFU9_BRAAE|nr:unnamed protein product [Brassicogethes aeneus]